MDMLGHLSCERFSKEEIDKSYLVGHMIQAFFEELGKGRFIYDVKYNSDDHLTHLFFAHPTSI